MKNSFRAGFVVAVVGVAVVAPFAFAANEAIDFFKSGVANGAAVPATAAIAPPSFVDAEPADRVRTAAIQPSGIILKPVDAAPVAVPAPQVIDPITTASVPTLPVPVPVPVAVEIKASAEFREALAALDDGDIAGAFKMAGALKSQAERHTIQWAAIQYNSGKIDYQSIKDFMAEAPEFVSDTVFRARLEHAFTQMRPSAADVLAEFAGQPPSSVEAQILLGKAYLEEGDKDAARALATQIWVENFLTQGQEKRVLELFGSLLDREAHWQRAMHLMMHDRAKGSERLTRFLSDAQKSLVVARAAVSRNDVDAKAKLDSVDASMQTNPVFIYSRVQRALQFELWESAAEWLRKAPDEVPDAAEWWYERRTLVRKFLDLGQPKLAFEVADGYRNGPEGRMVEAHFHAGWIALAFLDDATAAKRHFSAMTEFSTLPDSVSQANYWLGRASSKLGDTAGAQAAFEAAAKFGTVYYGQLARAELGHAGVDLRPLPDAQHSSALFAGNAVVQGIRLLADSGKKSMAVTLLRQYGARLEHGGEFVLAAQLAHDIGAPQLSVAIAGIADARGAPLDIFSFPHNALPEDTRLAADRAAVFAVVRQESMFQIDAVSSAGARGLMQLMPGTAKEVAKQVGVDYSPAKLVSDPRYNALLGSTYLGKQLERYDGSLVLAAAAYNAGPGNANKWIAAYGDPRQSDVDPAVWIERIPFQETRTYVKRVLGNYLVYREQLGDSRMTLNQALRTIQ
ncbi:MAG: lytic transglycosylase protein [Devosia sp.]|nr:lytic transglycosylase protein [Devosia sp.]